MSQCQIATLRDNELFSMLGDAELMALASVGSTTKKSRGDLLFNVGDPPDGLYVVLQGEVGVYATDHRGNQLLLNVLAQGAVVGDIAVMDGQERTAAVTAHTAADLFFVPRGAFLTYLESCPKLCIHFAALLASRCRYVTRNMEGMYFMTAPQRVAHALLALARDGHKADDGLRLREPVNQSALALRVGLSREYVNKTMRMFVRGGIITYRAGYVTLCDMDHLKGIVDGAIKEFVESAAA
ncbi:Crp/Fnr family transcriptional regulator [Azospirillum sp. YIM DDC1]|uniref:Crp/Fnr family transcriptional regulator n=1 Tax=Azospirillum aestuarii TaxID=2802052 RepID=A0ABS1I6P4_9PROT|nr:Crp/Fnr family transcriptional regulator [Azospirillum aestuarii]MBK4722740.1 Crp/Fnr family transcriptional regulator [Azospirillum aestuarii]